MIPKQKGKVKTEIRGFWFSAESKKTYYDYLQAMTISRRFDYRAYNFRLYNVIDYIRTSEKQEAIFFIGQKTGYVFNNRHDITVLKGRIVIRHAGYKGLKDIIKNALKQYGGITVYINGGSYEIEIYYKKD